jgi:excisionase family DNA binding protein
MVTTIPKVTLSPKEASQMLGISLSHIYSMLYEGKIPALKFGKVWRIPTKGINDLLNNAPAITIVQREEEAWNWQKLKR